MNYPVWEYPWFAWGAAALALLLLIYLLRRRSERRAVSAIFLWDKPENVTRSGSSWRWNMPPGIFWLEALIVILLVLSMMSPIIIGKDGLPPLGIVLDNSYSMRQRRGDDRVTAQEAGARHVESIVRCYPGRRIIFVKAGRKAELLADGDGRADWRAGWRADEGAADIAGAIALIRSRCRAPELLVVTDAPPVTTPATDTAYFAAGAAGKNCALVNVRRGAETVLCEVANLSPARVEAVLRSTPGGEMRLDLAPRERRKVVFRLPLSQQKDKVVLQLSSPGDVLEFDDTLTLLPEEKKPLRFIFDSTLPAGFRPALERLLYRNEDYEVATAAELLFCGATDKLSPGGAFHRFIVHEGKKENRDVSAAAPVMRGDSELLDGVTLNGVIWAADRTVTLPGDVLIRSGRTPLLSLVNRLDGYCDIHINIDMASGNLARNAAFPALFWNVAELLRGKRSGLLRHNWRSGEIVTLKLPPDVDMRKNITVTGADGVVKNFSAPRGMLFLDDLPPGENTIRADDRHLGTLFVNAVAAAESDLSTCGRFVAAAVKPPVNGAAKPVKWYYLTLAAALSLLLWHQYLVTGGRAGGENG